MKSTPKTPRKKSSRLPKKSPSPPAPVVVSSSESTTASEPTRFRRLIKKITPSSKQKAADLERQILFSLRAVKWPSLRQLRHSGRVFNNVEKRILVGCFALITASTVWLGISSAGAHIIQQPGDGGSYTEAIIGEPRFLNPLYAMRSAADADITRLIYAGLFRYDANLSLVPDIAAGHTMSPDGKVYTVHLKPDIRWHDREPLTADDVVFTFTSAADKAIGSPLANNLRGTVVEKVDEQTVRFTLSDPYPAFLNILTTGIMPKHIWGTIPGDQWRKHESNLNPVGAGAWQFTNTRTDRDGNILSITLRRAPAREGEPTPHLAELIFKFYPDTTTAEAALRSHAVQGLALLASNDRQSLGSQRHLTSYDLNFSATTSIFFNLNTPSPVQTLAVRQALNAAINRNVLLTTLLKDKGARLSGPLPTSVGVQSVVNPAPTKSIDELLTDAGWTRTGALWKNKQDATLSVVLTVIDREPDRLVGQYILKAWQDIGIDARIDLIAPADAAHIQETVLRPRSYQALLYTTAYGATADPYPFWHSSQRVDPGLNLSSYSNKDADDAIEKARRTLVIDERNQALKTFQEIILKEVPAIFLYTPLRHYVLSDEIHGVRIGKMAMPADRFNTITEWYAKTKNSFQW